MTQPSESGSSWTSGPKGYIWPWGSSATNLDHTLSFSTNTLFPMESRITCNRTAGHLPEWVFHKGPLTSTRWHVCGSSWLPRPVRLLPESDPPNPVPEPSALVHLETGLLGIAGLAGWKSRKLLPKLELKATDVSPQDWPG
jgi:hypothetical protein